MPFRLYIAISISKIADFYHPRMWCGNTFSRVCLSVYVCVCQAVAYESFYLESSLLVPVRWYILGIPRSSMYTKVIGSRSRSQKQKGQTTATNYTHSRVVYLRLKGNRVIPNISLTFHISVTVLIATVKNPGNTLSCKNVGKSIVSVKFNATNGHIYIVYHTLTPFWLLKSVLRQFTAIFTCHKHDKNRDFHNIS